MKSPSNATKISIAVILAVGLAACDKPGPAESAGRKLDQTAEAAVKKLDQTAETAGRKIDQAVDKAGLEVNAQSAKTSVIIDDAEITAKVKASIFAEPGLKTLQISVDTVKGVVTLTGSVDSLSSSEKARAIAAAVAGVSEVKNRLMARPT